MTELFSNLGQTTINQVGGIQATDTTVVVSSLTGANPGNGFPATGNFRVLLGTDASSEITLCTSVNVATKTLTIARGQEGTFPKAWPNGTSVTISVTAQALNQSLAETYQVGPYSALPAIGRPTGSRYQTTDGHTPWVWNPYSGTWQPEIQSGILGVKPPVAATFTTNVNSAVSIVDSGAGALDFTQVTDAANSVIFHGFAFPFTGPGFVEIGLQHLDKGPQNTNNWSALGPFFYETSSTKIYAFAHGMLLGGTAPQEYMETSVFSNPSTRTASQFNPSMMANGAFFLRIRRDLVNVYADFSRDRVRWVNFEQRTIASVFTTAPDQIGIGGFSAGNQGFYRILHYSFGPYPTVGDQVFTANVHLLRSQIFMPQPNAPAPTQPTGWLGSVFHQ